LPYRELQRSFLIIIKPGQLGRGTRDPAPEVASCQEARESRMDTSWLGRWGCSPPSRRPRTRRRLPDPRRPVVEPRERRELLSRTEMLEAAAPALVKAARGAHPPALALSLLTPPGANGQAILGGKTKPKSLLKLDVGADGSIEQTVKADKKGMFQFKVSVGFGSTDVKVIGPGKASKAPVGHLSIVRPDRIAPTVTLASPVPGGLTNG